MAAWADDSNGLSLDRALHVFGLCDFAVLWLQLLFDKLKFLTLLGMIEPVGSYLLKTFGQNML